MKLRDLLSAGPVVADGAWGTELQKRGLSLFQCPDAWNLERPDAVTEVAKSYVEAGSRVILTNTFRGTRVALTGYGLADRTQIGGCNDRLRSAGRGFGHRFLRLPIEE